MNVITANTTVNTGGTSNLYLTAVEFYTGNTMTFKHKTSYHLLQNQQVLPNAVKNVADALQDAIRVYFRVCVKVSTFLKYNTQTQALNLKVCTDMLENCPSSVRLVCSTSNGHYILDFQLQKNTSCVPGPFQYTAVCQTSGHGSGGG